MTREIRKKLRKELLHNLCDDMMPLTVAGHTITDQYVYAGCSQWCQQDRHWDETRHAYAYIVDGQYQLTFPELDYHDGHNRIEIQTQYYLQPDRSEVPPSGPEGEPLQRVPDKVLLEIAAGLSDAIAAHQAKKSEDDTRAVDLITKLKGK